MRFWAGSKLLSDFFNLPSAQNKEQKLSFFNQCITRLKQYIDVTRRYFTAEYDFTTPDNFNVTGFMSKYRFQVQEWTKTNVLGVLLDNTPATLRQKHYIIISLTDVKLHSA